MVEVAQVLGSPMVPLCPVRLVSHKSEPGTEKGYLCWLSVEARKLECDRPESLEKKDHQ